MTEATKTKKPRRSTEQMIADHEAEIARIRARAAAKELKANPSVQEALRLARALVKGQAVAKDAKDDALQEALSSAHAALEGYLDGRGLNAPKRGTRGPRKAV